MAFTEKGMQTVKNEWRVKYQKTPFSYTQPGMLMVEAECKAHAFVAAYDRLSRAGNTVNGETSYILLGPHPVYTSATRGFLTAEELEIVRAMGVPDEYGDTHIGSVDAHRISLPDSPAELADSASEHVSLQDWALRCRCCNELVRIVGRVPRFCPTCGRASVHVRPSGLGAQR
jgi:hypothetical protein